MIVKHDCKRKESLGYKTQTELYGNGNVVANINKLGEPVCTICGEKIPGVIVSKEKIINKR